MTPIPPSCDEHCHLWIYDNIMWDRASKHGTLNHESRAPPLADTRILLRNSQHQPQRCFKALRNTSEKPISNPLKFRWVVYKVDLVQVYGPDNCYKIIKGLSNISKGGRPSQVYHYIKVYTMRVNWVLLPRAQHLILFWGIQANKQQPTVRIVYFF